MKRQTDHSPGRSEAHDGKKKIPMDDEHLVAGGKVLKDNITLKDYGISGGETTELRVQLLGGMKHKSPSSTPMDTERDKKKKRIRTIY